MLACQKRFHQRFYLLEIPHCSGAHWTRGGHVKLRSEHSHARIYDAITRDRASTPYLPGCGAAEQSAPRCSHVCARSQCLLVHACACTQGLHAGTCAAYLLHHENRAGRHHEDPVLGPLAGERQHLAMGRGVWRGGGAVDGEETGWQHAAGTHRHRRPRCRGLLFANMVCPIPPRCSIRAAFPPATCPVLITPSVATNRFSAYDP